MNSYAEIGSYSFPYHQSWIFDFQVEINLFWDNIIQAEPTLEYENATLPEKL